MNCAHGQPVHERWLLPNPSRQPTRKCPPLVERRRAILQVTLSSENKPQPELHDSSIVCIRSRCYRAKVRKIANIAVGCAENHSVEKVASLSTEFKLPPLGPDWESSDHREVQVPVALRLEAIWAKVAERARRRSGQRSGVE